MTAIVGPSGSGKTTALNHITARRSPRTGPPLALDHALLPLLDRWELPSADAVRILCASGLTDPFSWCRTAAELSDGQAHRLEIADGLASPDQLIVIDDFTAKLDRVTARAVAWTASHTVRKAGKSLLIATTHEDILADLRPDTIIRKGWQPECQVEHVAEHPPVCSVTAGLTYRQGTYRDYAPLAPLHYAAGAPATVHSVHCLDADWSATAVAVAILSWPGLHSAARNLVTDGRYSARTSRYAAQALNREVLNLSRIIVTPEIRGVGVAARLLTDVIARTNARYIECSTAMGRFSRFLEQVGFREAVQLPASTEASMLDFFDREGCPAHAGLDPAALADWTDGLSVRKRREARQLVWYYYHHFVLWRRTRQPVPKAIPNESDPRWPDAWARASERVSGRPLYYILGPLDPITRKQQEIHEEP